MPPVPEPALQDAAARLAVLPFDGLSPDPGDAWFARGFVEDLMVEPSRLPGIEVLHADGSLAMDGGAAAPGVAAVSHRLCGTVHRTTDAVRVTAQLTDVATGQSCWTERFDVPLAEIPLLQVRNACATTSSDGGRSGCMVRNRLRKSCHTVGPHVSARYCSSSCAIHASWT